MSETQSSPRAEHDSYQLFMDALEVVNEAIAAHRDSAVFGFAIGAAEQGLAGNRLGVAVYADDPDHPFDYFTLRFTRGRFELFARGKSEPDVAWKVSRDYLQDLVENPKDYVDNPVKLDLDWLKDRAGL